MGIKTITNINYAKRPRITTLKNQVVDLWQILDRKDTFQFYENENIMSIEHFAVMIIECSFFIKLNKLIQIGLNILEPGLFCGQ